LAAALLVAGSLDGQARCALQDPKQSVFQGFPEADGFRAIVREVGGDERGIVDADLPFTVHFNELGEHTLYVALRRDRPIGIVHTRSEESPYGLVEIIWFLTLELKVKSFRFQRCRSPRGEPLERSQFAESLIGRDFTALATLLTQKGDLVETVRGVPKRGRQLARTVVRSALKTIVVTNSVWTGQLEGLRDLDLAMVSYPEARTARPLGFARDKPSPFERDHKPLFITSLRAVRGVDGRGQLLGTAVRTHVNLQRRPLELVWSLGSDGRIADVACLPRWPSAATGADFRRLVGRTQDSPTPVNRAEQIAAELLLLVSELQERGRR